MVLLVQRHNEDYITKLGLEMTPMDDKHDIMLPHWWLQTHEPERPFEKSLEDLGFQSKYCRLNCTGLKATAAAVMTTEQTATEISRIPPLDVREATEKFPNRKPWDHEIVLEEGTKPIRKPTYVRIPRL